VGPGFWLVLRLTSNPARSEFACTSQTRTIPSPHPAAANLASGLRAAQYAQSGNPPKALKPPPLLASHIRTDLSAPALIRYFPLAENDRSFTCTPWPSLLRGMVPSGTLHHRMRGSSPEVRMNLPSPVTASAVTGWLCPSNERIKAPVSALNCRTA